MNCLRRTGARESARETESSINSQEPDPVLATPNTSHPIQNLDIDLASKQTLYDGCFVIIA